MRSIRVGLVFLAALALWGGATVGAAAADAASSVLAWTRWKSIDAAIALRPLDGPEDILEKAEIIEDRVDALKREKARLGKEIDEHHRTLPILRNQREILREVVDSRLGGDSQTRQRLQDLDGRIRREEASLTLRRESVTKLEAELIRLTNLAAEYRERARTLRLNEGGSP